MTILFPSSATQPGSHSPGLPPQIQVALATANWWLMATAPVPVIEDDEIVFDVREMPPAGALMANAAFDVLTDYMTGKTKGAQQG